MRRRPASWPRSWPARALKWKLARCSAGSTRPERQFAVAAATKSTGGGSARTGTRPGAGNRSPRPAAAQPGRAQAGRRNTISTRRKSKATGKDGPPAQGRCRGLPGGAGSRARNRKPAPVPETQAGAGQNRLQHPGRPRRKPAPAPPRADDEREVRVRMSRLRRRIAERLKEAQKQRGHADDLQRCRHDRHPRPAQTLPRQFSRSATACASASCPSSSRPASRR